jgi:acetoacetyl-CoA synthetase
MYLSAVSGLLFGGRCILYDGSPFQPDVKTFIQLIGSQKLVTAFKYSSPF